jgi:catechol 2,3-dioxygenase-like lactoylglutathione lyase family enzyme
MDLRFEVLVIPVSDVDRAKAFYEKLGFRLDIDYTADERFRVLQFTPPGSGASIIFGKGITSAKPGSLSNLVLAVDDVEAARRDLIARGAAVSEVFHFAGGPFNNSVEPARVAGRDPQGRSYFAFASFSDPDKNEWLLQEVTTRLPGRMDMGGTSFGSASDLASAMRRASTAHGEHEARLGGQRDENWPDWYAAHMVAEQAGTELPR